MLFGATAVMLVGAAIPFFAPSLRDAPWSDDTGELLGAVAGNPTAWIVANTLFVVAAVGAGLGLVAMRRRFEASARTWAEMGSTVFVVAAAAEVVGRVIGIGPATWAAEQGIDATTPAVAAFARFDEGLSSAFFILGFASVGLLGAALTRAPDSAGWGWTFVAVGGAGAAVGLFGGGIPAMVYFALAGLAAATWPRTHGRAGGCR